MKISSYNNLLVYDRSMSMAQAEDLISRNCLKGLEIKTLLKDETKKWGQANNTLTQQSRRIINVNKKTLSISEGESKRGNDHGPNISNGGFRGKSGLSCDVQDGA